MSPLDARNDLDQLPPRFVVGIDLGTTNCAISFVDTEVDEAHLEDATILQWIDVAEMDRRPTLPSFAYQPTATERETLGAKLPWDGKKTPHWFVGVYARDVGGRTPGRQIVSAKSWLCHAGVDRTTGLLPWQAVADVSRLSPVEASSLYLKHLRESWDHDHADAKLADQDVVITIPASFDEVAREFTIDAAKRAGLQRVTLIEEPQAAFYAWLDRHHANWEELVAPGDIILVCDIGGGTSDFTLIQARASGEASERIRFHRLAVGDHLILGGDNLDLALAHYIESRLEPSRQLSPHQWDRLVRQARTLKEDALSDQGAPELTAHLAGGGSRLLGGAQQVRLTRDEVRQLLLEGFFPQVDLDAKLQESATGFTEFGLPYASDAAITRHLAQFLRQHRDEGASTVTEAQQTGCRPDIVLFNGGMFESSSARDRIVGQLETWFRTEKEPDWSPRCLDHDRLDLAVARGAASFGMVRRGKGTKISAGLARSYYIGVTGQPPQAVCLLPAGAEPGHDVRLQQPQFELRVGTPIELPIYSSSVRLNDAPGSLIDLDSESLKQLPPIRTVISGKQYRDQNEIPVELHASLTEVGTMDLYCQELNGEGKWKLQFDVRSATHTDVTTDTSSAESEGILDESIWERCQVLVKEAFAQRDREPDRVVQQLSDELDSPRDAWPPSLLRRLWETLLEREAGRQLSARHEARWLNLVGFFLRPGYGMAMDDWRVATTWKLVQGKLFHESARCRAESWILWRRVAGGLTSGQQETLATPLLVAIRQTHKQSMTGRGKGAQIEFGSHEAAEIWRLLGSLERLPQRQKVELGNIILDLAPKRRFQASRDGMLWALGRLASRRPFYGLLNDVVDRDVVSKWVKRLMDDAVDAPMDRLTMMQMARFCDDRYRDLDASLRQAVADWLQRETTSTDLSRLVLEGGQLDHEQETKILGDSLPVGLRLRRG